MLNPQRAAAKAPPAATTGHPLRSPSAASSSLRGLQGGDHQWYNNSCVKKAPGSSGKHADDSTAEALMAEEMSQRISDGTAVEGRSKRKRQARSRLAPSTADGPIVNNGSNAAMEPSPRDICAGMDADGGVLYLNPQTPNWSLVEKFAELSPGDPTEAQDLSGEVTRYTKRTETNKVTGPNEMLLDARQSKEGKCSEHLRRQGDAPAKRRTSELKELNGEKYPPSRGGGKTKKKSVHSAVVRKLLKDCEDDKIPRLLVAMKKRGELDAEDRPFKCPHCPWAFKKLCNLQSHLQTHTGLKPHACDICGKAYSHQGTLQQHKRLHTGERPYRCPFCVKTYIWSSDYRKHIRTHTGEKPYICDTCGKDFIRSSDLRKHERNMHTNDKPFPCAHCGKTFNKPLSLKRHERKHLGERPFSCPDCGKAFTLASRMAEHQKIHKGVRPYACPVCAKRFTKSSNLAEHVSIHSGVRPHKCKECGVAFAMASRLVRHQFVHNKGKPHSCAGCGKSFSHLAKLKLHQENNCAGRIFICVECDKSFACASKLAEHVLTHERGAAEPV